MKIARSTAFLFSAFALALAGCSSNPATSTPAIANISGGYSGTMQDSVGGAGTASATLAQSGASVGGTIADAESSGTVTSQLALRISSNNATSGSLVFTTSSGTQCTFSTTGTYDPASNVLSGTYASVTNCSGESGSYTLTQQCSGTVTSHTRRDKTGVAPC